MAFYGFQSSFTAGELSPSLTVRVDLARYGTGCGLLENMLVHPHGGASKRNGLRFLADLGGKARLMPFVFSNSETYVLAWTEKKLSFFTSQGQVLDSKGRPYSIVTPFSYETAKKLAFVQSADVVYLVCEDFPPYKLSRFSHDSWKLEQVDFSPKVPAPSGLSAQLHDVRTEGEISGDGSGRRNWLFVVTQIGETGEESLPSEPCSVEGPENLRQTCYPKLTWTKCENATEYRIYQEKNGKYGYIGSSLTESFDAKNIAPDMTDCPPDGYQPFGKDNYPSCVCFYQQRLVFAGTKTKPQTLWFSRTGNFESFTRSSPTKADDAMEITIAGNEVSRIVWLVSLRTLLVGTGGTEWEVKSSGGALTASDVSLVPQSYRGSSPLPALIVGNSVLHVNRTHRELRDLMYDFGTDSYAGSDHAVLARHLFENHSITDWAYQQSPDSIIWCIRDDGVLLGHTYLREHEVFAWHRHQTQGKFLSLCALPGEYADELFCVTEREIAGTKRCFLECMENSGRRNASAENTLLNVPRETSEAVSDEIVSHETMLMNLTAKQSETASDPYAFYVDCGLSYHAADNAGKPIRYVGGLEHLLGAQVAIIADGAVCPQQKVRKIAYEENGEPKTVVGVDLGYYAKNIVAGLAYTAKLQSMPLEAETQSGSTLGRRKNVHKIGVYFKDTNYAKIGSDFENMDEVKWRRNEKPGEAVRLHSDYAYIHLAQGYGNQCYACIMSDQPLPLTVLALLPQVGVGM